MGVLKYGYPKALVFPLSETTEFWMRTWGSSMTSEFPPCPKCLMASIPHTSPSFSHLPAREWLISHDTDPHPESHPG